MKTNEIIELNEKDIEKAASSWSGYLYQGKVALYTAMQILNKLIGEESKEIDNYKIKIEELEDFTVVHNNIRKSIHQVKAKPTLETVGGYNEANLALLGKNLAYPEIEEAILHTAINIKEFSEEQLKRNIQNFNVTKKRERLKEFKQFLFEDKQTGYDEARKKLKLAQETNMYSLNAVVGVESISDLLQFEIKKFYEVSDYSEMHKVEENINYIYANFLFFMEDYVHRNHSTRTEIEFSLKYLQETLEKKSVFNFSFETIAVILLESISNQYSSYVDDYGIEELIEKEISEAWKRHVTALHNLDKKDFYTLCSRLTPHKVFNPIDDVQLNDILEIIEPTGIKDVFIRAILESGNKFDVPQELKNAYILKENGKFHSLTTLTDNKATYDAIGRKIFKNINKNVELSELLYDIDIYITGQINKEYQGTITNVKTDKDSKIILSSDNRETITESKVINFIDIDSFVGGEIID